MRAELRPAAVFAARRFRRATSRLRLLPAFLIIGTQPAGALPLFKGLLRHPDVAGPSTIHENFAWSRELHFFDQSFWRGVGWYRSCFPAAALRFWARRRGRDLVAGEVTAAYLFHPAVPERVAATIPNARLIALLRDPIERAYWSYEERRLRGVEPLSFEEALAAEAERTDADETKPGDQRSEIPQAYRPHTYFARGLYAEQLERWLSFFPREQLLVLRAEDFVAQPKDTYARVLDFVGLRPRQPRRVPVPEWTPAPIEPALRARLEERFAEPNARLARLLGEDFGWPPQASGTGTETAARSAP